jgi:hypothetical protein
MTRASTDPAREAGADRAQLEGFAADLLAGATSRMTPNGALVLPAPSPGLPRRIDGLQGFARSFLVAAFRECAEPSDALERYAEGLATGPRGGLHSRQSSDTWPDPRAEQQCLVEAASIAAALHFTRERTFERLPAKDQARLCAWLEKALTVRYPSNNWVLFPIIVRSFLISTGRGPADRLREDNRRAARLLESFYRGGGWYSDGPGDAYDHYNAWAIHFYRQLWSRIDPAGFGRTERSNHLDRLGAFAHDYVHLVGGDGSPLFFGRSLIYRCAGAGAFFAAAEAGVGPDPGVLRAAAMAMVGRFRDQISPSTLPSLGWNSTAFPPMVQGYSSPASPYWMGKACYGLTIPAEHPLWSAGTAPLPVQERDFVRLIAAPNLLVSGTVADGVVRAANHGSSHYPFTFVEAGDPHYRKISYSTASSPGYAAADAEDVGATSSAVRAGQVLVRRDFARLAGGPGYAASRWIARPSSTGRPQRRRGAGGVVKAVLGRSNVAAIEVVKHRLRDRKDLHEMESHSLFFGPVEIRVTSRRSLMPIKGRETGALISAADPSLLVTAVSDPDATRPWAQVRRADGLTGAVVGLLGDFVPAVLRYDDACPLGAHSAVAALTSTSPSYGESTHACAVVLGASAAACEAIAEDFALSLVEPRLVLLTRHSTGTRCWIVLGEETPRRITVGSTHVDGALRYVHAEGDDVVDVVGSSQRITAAA